MPWRRTHGTAALVLTVALAATACGPNGARGAASRPEAVSTASALAELPVQRPGPSAVSGGGAPAPVDTAVDFVSTLTGGVGGETGTAFETCAGFTESTHDGGAA